MASTSDTDDDEREMTDEEISEYYRAVAKSGGFDVPYFPESCPLGRINPIPKERLHDHWIMEAAEVAINDYNFKHETNFEFVEMEKANSQAARALMFYMTLRMKPSGTSSDHPTTTLQAQVLSAPEGYHVELLRILNAPPPPN